MGIERINGEWLYHSPAGRKYAVVELTTPKTGERFDVGIIMEVIGGECEECPEYKAVPGFTYGVADMSEKELLEWCGKTVSEYEAKEDNSMSILINIEMPTSEQGVRTINIYADGVVTNYAEETIGKAVPFPKHGG